MRHPKNSNHLKELATRRARKSNLEITAEGIRPLRPSPSSAESVEPMKRKLSLILPTLAGLMVLSVVFLPEVASFGWHLLHGDSVEFLVWEVPVPWGWRELQDNKSIIVQRIGRWNNTPSDAIVTTFDLPVGVAMDTKELKKGLIETQLKEGRRLMSEDEVQLDGEMGSCLTFGEDEHTSTRWIHCDFPVHRLSVGYIGTERHSHILRSIIKGIKPSRVPHAIGS
jgi:hypothetical protein